MHKNVESAKIRRKKAEPNSKDGVFPTLNTDARKDAHISQAKLAKELGVNTSTLVGYEKGRSPIKADLLIKYAQICNVSTDYLLGLSDCKSIENSQIHDKTGLSEESILMLTKHVVYGDKAKIKVIDFLLKENHIQPILSFCNGKEDYNDLGLLNLIAHYLIDDENKGVENLACITSMVNGGSSLVIDSKYLTKGVLLNLITQTLVEYKQEVAENRSKKKGSK